MTVTRTPGAVLGAHSEALALGSAGVWRSRIEVLVPTVLGVAILLFAAGSSSASALATFAHNLRWVGLLTLAATAALAAVGRRGETGPALSPVLPLLGFLAFALASSLWSVEPQLTVQRAGTAAILFFSVAAVSRLCAARSDVIERFMLAMVIAASLYAFGGVLVTIVHPATGFLVGPPIRFRGLGENPNTMPMLEAVVIPLGVWFALKTHGRRRALAIVALALLIQTMFLTGSRGAILASAGAVSAQLLMVRRTPRWRRRAIAGLTVVLFYGLFSGNAVQQFVHVDTRTTAERISPGHDVAPSDPCAQPGGSAPGTPPRPPTAIAFGVSSKTVGGLAGFLVPRPGTFWSGSGRLQAWKAAIDLANAKPAFGYGFGAEAAAFGPATCGVSQVFQGQFVHNSYIGLYLQVGAVGGLALLLVLGTLFRSGLVAVKRAVGSARDTAAALVASVIAGLVLAVFESYFYSVGNVATLAFWTCGALLLAVPTACSTSLRPRRKVPAV